MIDSTFFNVQFSDSHKVERVELHGMVFVEGIVLCMSIDVLRLILREGIWGETIV